MDVADRGAGSMIVIARDVLQTDTVVTGVSERLMRWAERRLAP